MSLKSYITLCIIGILYVITAGVAVVSPHGDSFALRGSETAQADNKEQDGKNDNNSVNSGTGNGDSSTDNTVTDPTFLFTNEAGLQIMVTRTEMSKNFASGTVTVDIDGQQVVFTAVHLNTLITYSGITPQSDMVVLKGDRNNISACRAIDLQKENNSYLIYADENGNPLDSEKYGDFCIYVINGVKYGFFSHMNTLDFG